MSAGSGIMAALFYFMNFKNSGGVFLTKQQPMANNYDCFQNYNIHPMGRVCSHLKQLLRSFCNNMEICEICSDVSKSQIFL